MSAGGIRPFGNERTSGESRTTCRQRPTDSQRTSPPLARGTPFALVYNNMHPMSFIADLKFALRSLARAKGLAITVIVTLALGIGPNAAMFSVIRVVLLRPLVNRDEARLIYIRQSAPGIQTENTTFSVPEIIDLRSRIKTVSAFGDFSTIGFTMVGGRASGGPEWWGARSWK